MERFVEFPWNWRKAVAAVTYLVSRPGVTAPSKYKIAKLLYLAEKYKLVRHGAVICGGEYRALTMGPVPQHTLDLLHALVGDDPSYSGAAIDLLRNVVAVDHAFRYPRLFCEGAVGLDHLSPADVEALDHVVSLHGGKDFTELKNLTHATEAYRLAWDVRRAPSAQAETMHYEDFFVEDEDSIVGAQEEMLENDEIRRALSVPEEL